MTEVRAQNVPRMAVFTSLCIMANCPLGAVCMTVIIDLKRTVTCDYYRGPATDESGSVVNCGYQGR